MESLLLYIGLQSREIHCELEKFDGHKSIDIAIPERKINIEVDGRHHHNYDQALSDLKRTMYSWAKGYFTLRVPNILIQEKSQFHEVLDTIEKIIFQEDGSEFWN